MLTQSPEGMSFVLFLDAGTIFDLRIERLRGVTINLSLIESVKCFRGFIGKLFFEKGDFILKEYTHWVLEGDWGGQIYLSVKVGAVKEERLEAALRIIDIVEWTCNECDGASMYQEVAGGYGEGISGGMGGGRYATTERIWIHDGLNSGLKTWVEAFLFGEVELPTIEQIFGWLIQEDRSLRFPGNRKSVSPKLYRLARVTHARATKCLNTAAPKTSSV